MSSKIILASQSPFRKMLLEQLGFEFKTASPSIDERQLEKNFSGELSQLAEHLSFKKAEAIANTNPETAVIGSDQVLIFEGNTFPKPNTMAEVIDRLSHLQGKTHELHTGLCLICNGNIQRSTTVARLTMKPLQLDQIKKYAGLDQPIGCAGGYKIEQKGPLLFTQIETTDYYSIIGLPLLSLVSMLDQEGISML